MRTMGRQAMRRRAIGKSIARVGLIRTARHTEHAAHYAPHHAHAHAMRAMTLALALPLRPAERGKGPKDLKYFFSIARANPPHRPIGNHCQRRNFLRQQHNGRRSSITGRIRGQTGRRRIIAALRQYGSIGVGNCHIENTGLTGGFCQQRAQPKHNAGVEAQPGAGSGFQRPYERLGPVRKVMDHKCAFALVAAHRKTHQREPKNKGRTQQHPGRKPHARPTARETTCQTAKR